MPHAGQPQQVRCPEGDEVPHDILGVLGCGPPGLYGASGAHGNTVPTGLRHGEFLSIGLFGEWT